MIIDTSRFGQIEVQNTDILTFPEGMLGFSKIHQYVLVENDDDSLFVWLQAVKKPSIAFPLLEPQLFDLKYKVELAEEDQKVLELEDLKFAKVFSIITIPSDPSKMTANLKAPIVINLNKRLAHQVILHDLDYAIRQPVFADLQRHCSTTQQTIFPEAEEPAYRAIAISEEMATPATL